LKTKIALVGGRERKKEGEGEGEEVEPADVARARGAEAAKVRGARTIAGAVGGQTDGAAEAPDPATRRAQVA
jgi:hypothetical protein